MASSWLVPLEDSSRDCLTLRIQHYLNRSENRKMRIYATTRILFTPINLTVLSSILYHHYYRWTFSQRERSYVAPAFEIIALTFKRNCLQFRYILLNDVERRHCKIHDRLRHAQSQKRASSKNVERDVAMVSRKCTFNELDKLSFFPVLLLVL